MMSFKPRVKTDGFICITRASVKYKVPGIDETQIAIPGTPLPEATTWGKAWKKYYKMVPSTSTESTKCLETELAYKKENPEFLTVMERKELCTAENKELVYSIDYDSFFDEVELDDEEEEEEEALNIANDADSEVELDDEEEDEDEEEEYPYSYEELKSKTITEIKTILADYGVKYKSRSTENTLLTLAINNGICSVAKKEE